MVTTKAMRASNPLGSRQDGGEGVVFAGTSAAVIDGGVEGVLVGFLLEVIRWYSASESCFMVTSRVIKIRRAAQRMATILGLSRGLAGARQSVLQITLCR